MAMTSRELVRRTLRFQKPDRTPRHAWVLPWAEEHSPGPLARLRREFPDDIATVPQLYRAPLPVVGSRYAKGDYVDEWGCRFRNVHGGVIGVTHGPLISDWSQLEGFRAPEAPLAVDADAVRAFCRGTQQFTLAGTLIRPFERLQFIRTVEQAMVDLAEEPPELLELLRRIHEHYVRETEAWARTDVDAIVIMDDWGGQRRMLASPWTFRRHFRPMYEEYAEIARRYGKFVFMHSDGHILDIVEDLIALGVDALNSQVAVMGVEELGRRFAGRLTFWGEVDRQILLSRGTKDEVARAVREMRAHLYADGGVIAECEFGPGAQPENVLHVFETWRRIDEGA